MKWREDRAYKESNAVQIKTWGDDALRNTITKMPSEGIDVVSWFVSIDKLFEQLNVPTDLQAILIRPILIFVGPCKAFNEQMRPNSFCKI